MNLILEFEEFKSQESKTRTKSLDSEQFLKILNENCKNFSFNNDLLWRGTNNKFGQFGLWFQSERKYTIGDYNYKNFFEERKDYPVPRYKSLIGSTESIGAKRLSSDNTLYLLIPFDNSDIIFAGCPDLALWSRVGQEFSDDLFIMKKYVENFKVPTKELFDILYKSKLSSNFGKMGLGFEFFTSSSSLLLHSSKVDWLEKQLDNL